MSIMKKSECYLVLIAKKIKKWRESDDPYWKEEERKKLFAAFILYLKKKEQENKRKFWVRNIFTVEQRLLQGASHNLVREMLAYDHEMYKEFFRIDPDVFEELFTLLEPRITKQTVVRVPIPARTRLEICIRFLASGDITKSIGFLFRVAPNTVSKIVSEVSEAIWDALSPIVFPPLTEEMWKEKAAEFEAIWNYPNCVGGIDGKHITCQAPANSGSVYWNYKNTCSVVLLAVADARAMFTMVDIGAEGRNSDEGLLLNSKIGEGLITETLNFPAPAPIEVGGPALSFVLAGDEAFGLTTNVMRPFPSRNGLTLYQKVYNYRHSRTRRIIECAFGIYAARWHIFKKPICADVDNLVKYIKAGVCLHNFLISKELLLPRNARKYPILTVQERKRMIAERNAKNAIIQQHPRRFSVNGASVRNAFMNYFCGTGQIPGQWERAARNQF